MDRAVNGRGGSTGTQSAKPKYGEGGGIILREIAKFFRILGTQIIFSPIVT